MLFLIWYFQLQDIQKAERNQSDCERRIKELNDVLERSYTDLQDSLYSMDIGKVSWYLPVFIHTLPMISEGSNDYTLHG